MVESNKHHAHNPYLFHPVLDRYLQEKLKIEQLKREPGYELSNIDMRRVAASDKNKVKVLNNHVFPAMSNLLYFFEFINRHAELDGVFDDDIQDLFGLRGSHVKRHKLEDSNYLVFLRFLDAILSYSNTLIVQEKDGITYTERRNRRKGFDAGRNIRLQLISAIVDAALQSLQGLAGEKEGEEPTLARLKIGSLIAQDFQRTSDWRDYYCTSQIKQNTDHPHRKIGF